jgi:hypothetical protein
LNSKIKLARAEGLLNGVQGALKHVLVLEVGVEEEVADKTLTQVNKILDEVRELIVEVANSEEC